MHRTELKGLRVPRGPFMRGALAAVALLGVLGTVREARAEEWVYKNWAQGALTAQSSTGWGGVSSRAVDGNTDGNFWGGSVTHTDLQPTPWWIVDLGNIHPNSTTKIDNITIYNRTDCCAERLDNVWLVLSENLIPPGLNPSTGFPYNHDSPGVKWTFLHEFPESGVYTWNPDMRGRFFQVIANHEENQQDILSLAEVEIYRAVWIVG